MKRTAILAFAVLMLAIQMVPATRADDANYFMLTGKVYFNSTQEPVKGAEITVGTYNAVSFDDGYYSMRLAEGNYTVKVTASGYRTYNGNITIQGSNVTKDIEMKKAITKYADCVILGPAVLLPLAAVARRGFRHKRIERA